MKSLPYLGLLAVVITALYMAWCLYAKAKSVYYAVRVTTPLGRVRLTPRVIKAYSWKPHAQVATAPFPESLWRFIRPLKSSDLGRLSAQLIYNDEVGKFDNVKRAATISAALYGVEIPASLLLVDGVTAALYCALQREMQLVWVKEPPAGLSKVRYSAAGSPILTEMLVARYTSQLELVAKIVFFVTDKGAFPNFDVYRRTFNTNLKASLRDSYSESEIKSMVSAYAVLSRTLIPRSYVLMDSNTAAIVERMRKFNKTPLKAMK